MGVYQTLVEMLEEYLTPRDVRVVFGEENVIAQEHQLPMVVVVPLGGGYVEPGYVHDLNPNIEMLWATNEAVELRMWAFDTDNDSPAAHADAVADLRQRVLQAFQAQRALGLYFKPVNGRWQWMENAAVRYGRAYILTVQAEIAIVTETPVEATLADVLIDEVNIIPPG